MSFHDAGASGKYLEILSSSESLFFLGQDHYGRSRELFTDGTGLKDRLRFDWDLMFDVREAVAF
jgi:hypothetical protein